MRDWFFLFKMLFDFFKRLFGLADQTGRKRRADDLSNDAASNSVICAKKHCIARLGLGVYGDENDEEEISYLGDFDYSQVRTKDRPNGTSCTRRKFGGHNSQPMSREYRKNTTLKMNGKETNASRLSQKSMAAISNIDYRCSTLTKTNQLREKQEYSQLLKNFMPQQKIQVIRKKIQKDEASKSRRFTEIIDLIDNETIDLDKCETPVKTIVERESRDRELFSTPRTSTPQKFFTPRETLNHDDSSARSKDEEISIISVRKTPIARTKILEISSKAKTPREKMGLSMGKIIPTIRIDHIDDLPSMSKGSTFDKFQASTSARSPIEIIETNTLRDNFSAKAVIKHDFVPRISGHYKKRFEQQSKEAEELERMTCLLAKHNRLEREAALETRLALSMRLNEAVLDETEEPEEEALPELTEPMLQEIKLALVPNPPNQVLVESFGLRVTRKDIHTLSGLNWLNDEVINFYMNLLIVRGTSGDKYPKVHAMNTFFYPKLLSGGHSSLKRWTRKIDIFAQDIVVVPIHLGIHWCMSIIDFRDKTIRYFDSMGGSNPKCLVALRQYLENESMDKKKRPFDTNDWKLESMKDIPQQMNGSDCGVFSCMFAEFITGNRKITFTQQDMPYFRNKMVYEILKAKLL